MGGRIGICDLVDHLRIRLECQKAVREALGNQELIPSAGGNLDGDPFHEGGRAPTNVDCDVENGTFHHPHQLVLRVGGQLVVKAPQHASRGGIGVVVLDKLQCDAVFGELPSVPGFGKEAAFVSYPARHDLQDSVKVERSDLQAHATCSSTRRRR